MLLSNRPPSVLKAPTAASIVPRSAPRSRCLAEAATVLNHRAGRCPESRSAVQASLSPGLVHVFTGKEKAARLSEQPDGNGSKEISFSIGKTWQHPKLKVIP